MTRDKMDSTTRSIGGDSACWHPWLAKNVTEESLWSGTFQSHPHFVLPPKKNSALVIKRKTSDGQIEEVVVPKSIQTQKLPLDGGVGQSKSPAYDEVMVGTPEINRASFPPVAPTQHPQAMDDTEQIKRNFIESVWEKRKANPSGLNQPRGGETNVAAAATTIVQDLASQSLNSASQAKPQHIQEPPYFKASRSRVTDLKEAQLPVKPRLLPDESPEGRAVIRPALFDPDMTVSFKKHAHVASEKVPKKGPKQSHVKGDPLFNDSANRWPNKVADRSGAVNIAGSKEAIMETNRAEARRPSVIKRRPVPSKKALVDDSFTTRAQVVNVDGVYYDVETLKSTGLQDHALAKEFLESQSKKQAPATKRNEHLRQSHPISPSKQRSQFSAKPKRKAASPKIKPADQRLVGAPKIPQGTIVEPLAIQGQEVTSADPLSQSISSGQLMTPRPVGTKYSSVRAKGIGSTEHQQSNGILENTPTRVIQPEQLEHGQVNSSWMLSQSPREAQYVNEVASQEQEKVESRSTTNNEDCSDDDDDDDGGGVQLF